MLYGVEGYYAKWLLGIAPLYRVVLGIGILLGLVQYNEGLFLLTSYVVLDCDIEEVILSIYTCVPLFDVFNGCSLVQLIK